MAYKIIVVGNSNTGKTQTITRLTGDYYNEGPTQGVEVYRVDNLKIWDCGGTYRGLGEGYYCGANAAVVFADNKADVAKWIKEIYSICEIPVLVVGKVGINRDRLTIDHLKKIF